MIKAASSLLMYNADFKHCAERGIQCRGMLQETCSGREGAGSRQNPCRTGVWCRRRQATERQEDPQRRLSWPLWQQAGCQLRFQERVSSTHPKFKANHFFVVSRLRASLSFQTVVLSGMFTLSSPLRLTKKCSVNAKPCRLHHAEKAQLMTCREIAPSARKQASHSCSLSRQPLVVTLNSSDDENEAKYRCQLSFSLLKSHLLSPVVLEK